MDAIKTPLILYIPGLLPKPVPDVHKAALFRCLLEGVRRNDAEIAAQIAVSQHSFDLVSWTYDFYRVHRDIALDTDAIEAVIRQQAPSAEDIREAGSWVRRATTPAISTSMSTSATARRSPASWPSTVLAR